MTTLKARAPYTKDELKELYPSNLKLEQVQVLFRHGERTPVKSRFTEILPIHWPYCRSASTFRSAVLNPHTNSFSTLQWRRHLETTHSSTNRPVHAQSPARTPHDICDLGTLTDIGRQTTHALGERLRHLYVDQLGFLPSQLGEDGASDVKDAGTWLYLRTTPVTRALESLQQVYHGLYPDTQHMPTIVTRAPEYETLYPNWNYCARFKVLAVAHQRHVAAKWNNSPEMTLINDRVGKYMPAGAPFAVDSNPSLLGLLDTVNATRAHGPDVRLPVDFYDPAMLRNVENIALEEWFGGYAHSNEYRRLGVGALMGDMVSRMLAIAHRDDENEGSRYNAAADGKMPIKRLGLSGCHDTTIGGTIASLGVPLTDWPPFTSHIAMELFSAADNVHSRNRSYNKQPSPATTPGGDEKKDWYVRVRYNDEPVTIPGCTPPGNHLPGNKTFCTLDAFRDIVSHVTPKNWKAECAIISPKSA